MIYQLLSFFLIFCSLTNCFALENSIVPAMERFEAVENLPVEKFSKEQFEEISHLLQKKDKRLRIATYNILFNLKDDQLEVQNRWPQRLPRIVEQIKEMDADILAVQELYPEQLITLFPWIESTYSFYSAPSKEGELNGIFYRTSRFQVVESQVWYMSKDSTTPSGKTLTMLQLKDKKTGRLFAVFNTHLAFQKIEKRAFQAHFILDHIEKVAQEMPVILTGDLNTFGMRLDQEKFPFYDGDYILRLLTTKYLRDARDQAHLGHLGPLSTFTNEPHDILPFKSTGTPGVFLDHILVSKEVMVLIHAVQPSTVEGHYPSDHLPVLIDIVLSD